MIVFDKVLVFFFQLLDFKCNIDVIYIHVHFNFNFRTTNIYIYRPTIFLYIVFFLRFFNIEKLLLLDM